MALYALNQAAGYVEDALAAVSRARNDLDGPAEGSPAARELGVTGARARQHVLDAHLLARLRLVVVEDYLRAMARIVRAPDSMYPLYPLARSGAETAARAWWLLDPTLTPRERAERGLDERIYSLQQVRQLPIEEAKQRGKSRVAELRSDAQREGLSVSRTNRYPSTATVLLSKVFEDDAEAVAGELMYKRLSAFDHGTAYAIHSLVNTDAAQPSVVEGVALTSLQVHASDEALALLTVWVPWTKALTRHAMLYGWRDEHVVASVRYAGTELRRALHIRRD